MFALIDPRVWLAFALAIGAASLLSAGTAVHYTGKYYKAQAAALEAKREQDATRANAAERIKETVAASASAEQGLRLRIAEGQLESAAQDRLAAVHDVARVADLQRVLDAQRATDSIARREAASSARIVFRTKDSGDDLADCRETARIATTAATLFDSELRFCSAGLTAWSERENFLRGVLK